MFMTSNSFLHEPLPAAKFPYSFRYKSPSATNESGSRIPCNNWETERLHPGFSKVLPLHPDAGVWMESIPERPCGNCLIEHLK